MCGRYSAVKDPARLVEEFEAIDATGGQLSAPDYNVAPTKAVAAVVQRHPRDAEGNPDPDTTERTIRVMRWGLVPSWAKDPGVAAKMINARSETAAEKPAYRTSVKKYRCLMPAAGWYEWQQEGGTKQPFYVTDPDGASLAMAALWATWRRPGAPEESPLVTCAVLTTDAFGPLAGIHHRMPLLLPREKWADWLDPDREDVAELLLPPAPEVIAGLELRPVSTAVNNVRNNEPGLMDRVEPGAVQLDAPPQRKAPARKKDRQDSGDALFELP
ncbi:putative SOS response-associated peptidase YedK [Crossiella equi]|uniref:Abasic site processing protein n=1 Tax=Crossiella equi TaxID=130796 RepID=A0ABS5AD96_9PSEU|nr:SOS response-associated peptidase [Crossiella equi]MBP2474547.1 putative SOS response-associated peptidase YedK [Crossiella equi]